MKLIPTLILSASPALADFSPLFTIGENDGSYAEFANDNANLDPAPGSAVAADDHHYLAGTYPAPIGVVLADEPTSNFERDFANGDDRNVVYFSLTSGQATGTGIMRVIADFVRSANNGGGPVENVITMSVNGVTAFTSASFQANTVITAEFPTAGLNLVAGANRIEISRTGVTTNSYLTFDQFSALLDPIALLDSDNDGIPLYWETQFQLSDNDPSDAADDFDRDGLSNLQEFQKRTNPRLADTDGDGLNDGTELVTDPLNPDSDGDGLLDGEEVNSDPNLVDSDGDGSPDPWEIQTGYPANNGASTPPVWKGGIAINFRSDDNATLGTWPNSLPNGIVPQIHWNQTNLLRDYGVSTGAPLLTGNTSDIASPGAGVLVDSNGDATTATISFTHDGVRNSGTAGSQEAAIFNGYLANDADFPATFAMSSIPATIGTYDIYVYLTAPYLGPLATIRLNGQFLNDVYCYPQAAGGDLSFLLFQPNQGPAAPRANVVRFRNQTARTFSLQDFRTDQTSGISAIQIIDVSTDSDANAIPDSWEIQFGADATTDPDPDGDGLNWLAEFNAGSDPHRADTDGDGLDDAAEVAAGTNAADVDSDDDGLSDFDELTHPLSSNPTLADSDNDGLNDFDERRQYADPMDPAINTLPVPVYPAAGQVMWEVNNLHFIKDHGDGIESDSGTNRDFIDWRVGNLNAGTTSALRMRIPRRSGKMTFEASTSGGGSFTLNGNSFTRSDNNTDLTAGLGFTGFGSCDTSDPLTFRMLATDNGNPSASWTVVFSIINQKTAAVVASQTVSGCEAVPTLLNQSAAWGTTSDPGRSQFIFGQGIRLFRTATPIEQQNGLAGCADDDNDGMSNDFEIQFGLNPNSAADASLDSDNDGLTNLQEAILGSSPNDSDSDDDGVSDFVEAHQFSDPMSANSTPPLFNAIPSGGVDLNGNGISDLWESKFGASGISPNLDSDGDGLSNLEEAIFGTDPFDPSSAFQIRCLPSTSPNAIDLIYPRLTLKNQELQSSITLDGFSTATLNANAMGEDYLVTVPFDLSKEFFRVRVADRDSDLDGLSDWDESILGSSPGSANSLSRPIPFDSNGDGIANTTINGDYAVFLEKFAHQQTLAAGQGSVTPTRSEAARLLMQATFGPTMSEIRQVRAVGLEAWIDDQIENQVATHHEDYIAEIQADLNGPRLDLSYLYNTDQTRVEEENLQTSFARAAISGPDQLRQRVAYALSQILVISRQDGAINQNVQSLARYYDRLVDNAFGNFYDILMGVTLDPNMGRYLSHVGNQPPEPAINRYPDENYAREVMQLFSIGLWQLNQDGTRKLNATGNQIPTYDNETITELARVMTGLWFANNKWGTQTRQDSEHLVPMEMHPDYHDFGQKTLLNGFVIPARPPSRENGMQDIRDAIRHLFEHPNCAPFISKGLIQFLVTSNPSPAYVERISDTFDDNGSGIRGDLGSVVKAILLDPEARDPAVASSPNFGIFREPVIRTMHLARLTKINRSGKAAWWDYGDFYEDTAQMPLFSPTVFNFYRPDYTPPGTLDHADLDGPAFEITTSYTAVSLPNRLWKIADQGFDMGSRYHFTPDYGDFMPFVDDPDTLLDYINLVVCSGHMSAATRLTIKTTLYNTVTSDPVELVRLAVYLSLMSPEGSVQR